MQSASLSCSGAGSSRKTLSSNERTTSPTSLPTRRVLRSFISVRRVSTRASSFADGVELTVAGGAVEKEPDFPSSVNPGWRTALLCVRLSFYLSACVLTKATVLQAHRPPYLLAHLRSSLHHLLPLDLSNLAHPRPRHAHLLPRPPSGVLLVRKQLLRGGLAGRLVWEGELREVDGGEEGVGSGGGV